MLLVQSGLYGKAHHTPVASHPDAPQQASAKQPRLLPSQNEGSDAQYSSEPRRSGRTGAGEIDLFNQSEHAAWTEAWHSRGHERVREISNNELCKQRESAVAWANKAAQQQKAAKVAAAAAGQAQLQEEQAQRRLAQLRRQGAQAQRRLVLVQQQEAQAQERRRLAQAQRQEAQTQRRPTQAQRRHTQAQRRHTQAQERAQAQVEARAQQRRGVAATFTSLEALLREANLFTDGTSHEIAEPLPPLAPDFGEDPEPETYLFV